MSAIYMLKTMPLKFISRLVLIVMLTVTINSLHESAHAMSGHDLTQNSPAEMFAGHSCPCAPMEQHKDYDGCDNCINCVCHAPLTVKPFQLDYNPIIVELSASDPFKFLPEVYLSKFIPPQKQA